MFATLSMELEILLKPFEPRWMKDCIPSEEAIS